MNRTSGSLALLFALTACANGRVPAEDASGSAFLVAGKADTGTISEGSPGANGVLALVNAAGRDLLVDDVGLTARVADNIMNVKVGDDGFVGTADDLRFTSLAQLDAVPYVGPTVFAALLSYAESHGFIGGAGADAGTRAIDAPPWYTPDAPAPDAPSMWVPDAPSWNAPDAPSWNAPDAPSWYAPDAPPPTGSLEVTWEATKQSALASCDDVGAASVWVVAASTTTQQLWSGIFDCSAQIGVIPDMAPGPYKVTLYLLGTLSREVLGTITPADPVQVNAGGPWYIGDFTFAL